MPIEITMPRLSDTMEAGTIIKWNVKPGDRVSPGDVVADVETDKATMEMQVFDEGKVERIVVPEGKTVDVGTTIAVLAGEGEPARAKARAGAEAEAPTDAGDAPESGAGASGGKGAAEGQAAAAAEPADQESPARMAQPAGSAAPGESPRTDGRIRVSPLARQLAEDHQIDLASIQGSGPGGRIIKRDVLAAAEAAEETRAAVAPAASRSAAPAAPARRAEAPLSPIVAATGRAALESRDVALSSMRQTIARRLVESKTTIPHYQVTVTFAMDELLRLRQMLNQQLEAQGVRLSINDFLIRACALAMAEHPEFNSSFAGDHIRVHGDVNIGIAVSLPPERGGGLVVATIRNADAKSLRAIALESRALAEKARGRGLSAEEMQGSTFTISNLGMFGVEHFTAIINPPNTAILAVGAALEKPVVRDGQLAVGHEMSATLSLDHRVIDGAMAAQYLATLKEMIERPGTILV